MRELLTVGELAKKLKIHKHSIYRLISKKTIPHFKIPGVGIRFDPDEIEKWARESEFQVEYWDEKVRGWN